MKPSSSPPPLELGRDLGIVIPPKIAYELMKVNPWLTLCAVVGGIRFRQAQYKVLRWIGISKSTMNNHLNIFQTSYAKLEKNHRPTFQDGVVDSRLLREQFYQDPDHLRSAANMIKLLPEEALRPIFDYLYDQHFTSQNKQLIESFKQNIDDMATSINLRSILKLAVEQFEKDPTPAWSKNIVDILKDIEAGKLKNEGLQKDGSCIYRVHLARSNVELLEGKDVDIQKFLEYALLAYRKSLKKNV